MCTHCMPQWLPATDALGNTSTGSPMRWGEAWNENLAPQVTALVHLVDGPPLPATRRVWHDTHSLSVSTLKKVQGTSAINNCDKPRKFSFSTCFSRTPKEKFSSSSHGDSIGAGGGGRGCGCKKSTLHVCRSIVSYYYVTYCRAWVATMLPDLVRKNVPRQMVFPSKLRSFKTRMTWLSLGSIQRPISHPLISYLPAEKRTDELHIFPPPSPSLRCARNGGLALQLQYFFFLTLWDPSTPMCSGVPHGKKVPVWSRIQPYGTAPPVINCLFEEVHSKVQILEKIFLGLQLVQ